MYGEADDWNKAQQLASQYLDAHEVAEMFIEQAEVLENNGKYRDAEKLYISIDAADLAIAMYKKAEQYENMVSINTNITQFNYIFVFISCDWLKGIIQIYCKRLIYTLPNNSNLKINTKQQKYSM